MSNTPVEFIEERVPSEGIEETITELVELYGGEITRSAERERQFILPLRRGVAAGGGVECTLTWSAGELEEGSVRMVCDRDVDAPKAQRIAMLVVGVIGSVLFMMWPFVEARREFGTLAWAGGAVALAVYFLTLRRTSGGIAFDFLQRLARRQREMAAADVTAAP